jgi:hypothetical protein
MASNFSHALFDELHTVGQRLPYILQRMHRRRERLEGKYARIAAILQRADLAGIVEPVAGIDQHAVRGACPAQ